MNYRANTHWYFLVIVGILTLGVAAQFDFKLKSTTLMERSIASEQISSTRQPDGLFFTFNPKITVEGPFLGDLNYLVSEEHSTRAYVNQTFSLIVQHSLQRLKGYVTAKDHFAVKAFILASLLTPFHESRWTHFRALPVLFDKCIEDRNTGQYTDKIKGNRKVQVKNVFENTFRTQNSSGIEPVVDCNEISKSHPALQLLGSYDLLSTGLYQPVMLFGHVRDFYEPQSYLSLDDSVSYGVGYLYEGFRKLYGTVQKYKCLYRTVENPKTQTKEQVLDIDLFVRGLWAGHFNSGQVGKACRFEDAENAYSKNDRNFKIDLDIFKNLHKDNSVFYKWLNSENRRYFEKLVSPTLEPMNLNPSAIQLPRPVIAFDYQRAQTVAQDSNQAEENKDVVQPEEGTSGAPAVESLKKIRIVNCVTLNARIKPPRGAIKAVLNVGAEFVYISKRKMTAESLYEWYEIIYEDKKLWVLGKFAEEINI